MELNLKGKHAIVTGGSRGLGAAICERLAREGADVLLTYASNAAMAEAVVTRLTNEYGVRAACLRADVSVEADVRALFRAAEDLYQTVDILVNNAGVCPVSPIKDTSLETWNAVMAVNLGGVFLCCREMVNLALAAGKPASIINVASATAYFGSKNGKTHYAASKGGVLSFTVSLAKEMAASGIRVNAIAPSIVHTDMTAELLERDEEHYKKQIPIGRIAELDEVASAVAFLAGDASSYMTGSTLDLSGGQCGR
jgi:3-oxoacyl-[acyl-carrier protein] reductase